MPLIDLVSGALAADAGNPELAFDQIVAQASPDLLGAGIAAALRSIQPEALAPTFEDLFVRSDALQQATLLNHLIAAAPEAALAAAGGALAVLLAPGGSPGSALRGSGLELFPSIAPDPAPPDYARHELTALQATALLPADAGAIAAAVVTRAPSVLDDLGRFYATQPTLLVKTLGNPMLLLILREMQRRLRSG